MPLDTTDDSVSTAVTTDPVTPDLSSVEAKPDMADTVRELFRKMGSPGQEGRDPVHRPVERGVERGPDGKYRRTDQTAATDEVAETAEAKAAAAAAKPANEQAAKPEDSASADDPPAEGAVADPAAAAEVKPDAAKAATEFDKPPSSWSKEAQTEFATASAKMKEYIHKREQDFHKGLESYKGLANVGKLLHAEIAPYEAMIRSYKITPQVLIRDLMSTAHQLYGGTQQQKIQIVRNLAREYSIDLNAVVPTAEEVAAEATRPQPDPENGKLREELNSLKGQYQQLTASQEAGIKAEIDAFAQAPGHEHYESVKGEMAALLGDGTAKTLQEAYDNACYAKPEVRAILIAQQRENDRKQAAEKAAAAKKAASTNVKTRGTLPGAPVVKSTDMADTVRNVLRDIKARKGAA